jgi:predicted 5'-methylthioadenosine/S-adenosylhomocysteine nucleosidase
VLVVAATELELAFVDEAETLCCGIGPVEAALATAHALALKPPDGVIHIGVAGARTLEPGSLVIGTESIYCDLVDPSRVLPRIERVAPDASLLATASRALPDAHPMAISTSARVRGGEACGEVEAMEGFAVLRAAANAGVPALELRAISNRFEDERAAWRLEDAFAALARSLPLLLRALDA